MTAPVRKNPVEILHGNERTAHDYETIDAMTYRTERIELERVQEFELKHNDKGQVWFNGQWITIHEVTE
jgi:hypothetical protein